MGQYLPRRLSRRLKKLEHLILKGKLIYMQKVNNILSQVPNWVVTVSVALVVSYTTIQLKVNTIETRNSIYVLRRIYVELRTVQGNLAKSVLHTV